MRNEELTQKMVKEAVARMKMLKLYETPSESIITLFEQDRTLYVSTPAFGNRVGVLYTLTDAEKKVVADFEEETGCLAYHVIRNDTEFGVMYSILYVSQEEEEWEMDREDIGDMVDEPAYPLAYVYNAGFAKPDDSDLSGGFGEFGSIGVVNGAGGLCRVA